MRRPRHFPPILQHHGAAPRVNETAEIAKFTPKQIRSYEDSLKYYRDLKNSLDTAKEEGKEEGIEIGKIEVAKNLLKIGSLSISEISAVTGLSEELIKSVK